MEMINGKHALILGNACRIFHSMGVAPFSVFEMAPTFGNCVALHKVGIGYSIQSSHMVAPATCPGKGVPNYLDRISAFFSVFSAFWSPSRLSRKTDVLLNILRHVFHQVPRLTIQDFTQLHNGVNRHAPIVHQAIHSLWIYVVGLAKVNLLYPLLAHALKELCIGYRHSLSSFVPLSIQYVKEIVNPVCTQKYTNIVYHLWYIHQ